MYGRIRFACAAVAPSADAMDRAQASLAAVTRQRTPEENRALTVAGAQRDYCARVVSQVRK